MRRWRGCRSRQVGIGPPWASVLQAQNNHHAPHGPFVFSNPLQKASFLWVFSKTKPPFGGDCFVPDQWSWRESNPRPGKATICFLHAYPALIVGGDQVADSRTTPYLLYFHRQAGETIRLSLNCVRFLIGLVQGITARETSRPNTLCRD